MIKRSAMVGLASVFVASLAGCSSSTDVSKAANDAYHSHEAGPRPPSGARQGMGQDGAGVPAPGKG